MFRPFFRSLSRYNCEEDSDLRFSFFEAGQIRCALGWAAATLGVIWPALLGSAAPRNDTVMVSADVRRDPPQIRLRWPDDSSARSYAIYRKNIDDSDWGNPVAVLDGGASQWTDMNVGLGAAYEYQVRELTEYDRWNYGYLYSGIDVPMTENRGKVLLLVDNLFGRALAAEIARLEEDLAGDGWTVVLRYVSRSDSPGSVKAVIRSEYYVDPTGLKALFLFGHVPVPYSGNLNPDFHPNHLGAWPADVFYGDIDGTWTDSVVSSTGAEDPRNYNVPGDGKFDQSDIPSMVELEVGRVDLSDLPAFSPDTERDLLRRYLDKDHNFRHKVFALPARALLHDNFGEIDLDAPALDGWRNFAPMVDLANIREIPPDQFFPILASEGYLWSYGCGGGSYDHADGVGYTGDFAHTAIQTVFTILHGSYFGDWDTPDNFSRAPLASGGYTLACVWAGLPHWFLQHMALGKTLGFSTRLTQNFGGRLYVDAVNDEAGKVHIALMGDPTLRMHPVAPPRSLTGLATGGGVILNWTASPESVLGYHVYRGSASFGPFARLSSSLVTGTTFTDNAAPPGARVYMVRAVKLETSPSGTYYNPSQGIFVTVADGPPQNLPVVSLAAADADASEDNQDPATLVVTRNDSANELTIRIGISGSAQNGVDYDDVPDSVTFGAGSNSAIISIKPRPDNVVEGDESVTLTLLPQSNYTIGASPSATITIHDANPRVVPEISPLDNLSLDEDTSSPPLSFTIGPAQIPSDDLVVTARSSNPSLIPDGNIVLSGTGRERSLTLSPARNQSGVATIQLAVSNGADVGYTSFQVQVRPINDAPIAANDEVSAVQDVPLALSPAVLLANDADPDPGDALRIVAVELSSGLGGALAWDGSTIIYRPPPGFSGLDTFNYTIEDEAGVQATAQVNVQVQPSGRSASLYYVDGQLILRLSAQPGAAYLIQTTTDLQNWSSLETGTIGPDAALERHLSPKASPNLCFYRVLWR